MPSRTQLFAAKIPTRPEPSPNKTLPKGRKPQAAAWEPGTGPLRPCGGLSSAPLPRPRREPSQPPAKPRTCKGWVRRGPRSALPKMQCAKVHQGTGLTQQFRHIFMNCWCRFVHFIFGGPCPGPRRSRPMHLAMQGLPTESPIFVRICTSEPLHAAIRAKKLPPPRE